MNIKGISLFVLVFVTLILSNISLVGASTPGNISTCQTLDTPGVYTLTASMSIGCADCLRINTDNVTIDGAGFSLTGLCGNNYWGIYVGFGLRTNITIKNVKIYNFCNGIGFQPATNSSIDNVTLAGNNGGCDGGISMSASNNNVISNINATGNSNGIFLSGSSNYNSFSNIVADSNTNTGVVISGSNNNSFSSLSIKATTQGSISISGSSGNTFKSTTFYNDNGSIKIIPQVTIPVSTINTGNLGETFNNVFINSSELSFLNVSSNVTLYNLLTNFSNPVILRDGVECPSSICTNFTNLNAGNVSFSVTGWSNYGVGNDTIPPSIAIHFPQNTTYNNKTRLVNISASDQNLDTVWFFNGTGNVTYVAPVYVTFAEGSNLLTAYANDSAGNLNSTTVTFFIDTTPPNATNITPAGGSFNKGTTVTIGGDFIDATGVDTVLANITKPDLTTEMVALSFVSGNHYSGNFTNTSNLGTYNVKIIANDTLGNVNNSIKTSFTITQTITQPPSGGGGGGGGQRYTKPSVQTSPTQPSSPTTSAPPVSATTRTPSQQSSETTPSTATSTSPPAPEPVSSQSTNGITGAATVKPINTSVYWAVGLGMVALTLLGLSWLYSKRTA